MDSSAGITVELAGPLAPERAVLAGAVARLGVLATIDCSGFSREAMADHAIAMVTATEQAAMVSSRFVAIAQEQACSLTKGDSSMTAALNRRCRISRRRGSQLDLIGSAKDRYHLFYAALLAGRITEGHIHVLHPVWKAVDRYQFGLAQPQLVELATLCTPEEFADLLGEWRHHADEDAHFDTFVSNQSKQHFAYGFDVFGNAHFSGTIGALQAEPFIETIEAEAKNHKTEDNLPSQALGDALVELTLNPDGKYRAHLEVLVPEHKSHGSEITDVETAEESPEITARAVLTAHQTSVDRANRIRDPFDRGFSTSYYPRTARGTLIPPAIIQQLKAQGARVREHLVTSHGDIAGDRHAGRHFSASQKRLIRLRDNHCQHLGCRKRHGSCEYDHAEPVQVGGSTVIHNGQLLCPLHHRWKHRRDHNGSRLFDDSPLAIPLE